MFILLEEDESFLFWDVRKAQQRKGPIYMSIPSKHLPYIYITTRETNVIMTERRT